LTAFEEQGLGHPPSFQPISKSSGFHFTTSFMAYKYLETRYKQRIGLSCSSEMF